VAGGLIFLDEVLEAHYRTYNGQVIEWALVILVDITLMRQHIYAALIDAKPMRFDVVGGVGNIREEQSGPWR